MSKTNNYIIHQIELQYYSYKMILTNHNLITIYDSIFQPNIFTNNFLKKQGYLYMGVSKLIKSFN